jgi:DNA-binding CsgD family transcriptional regulator
VTVKTVEMHLGNAYRKLDIGSRRELAPLLRAAQPQGAITGSTP